MDNNKYKVIISNNSTATDDSAEKLAGLLKLPLEKAQLILKRDEFIIKKETDKATAEKFHRAINGIGVHCKIEALEEEEAELPEIQEIQRPVESAPLIDPTRPEIPEEHQQQLNLGLEEMTDNQPRPDPTKESIDPERFCPECGTIRNDVDAICLHCGYDPATVKQQNRKSSLVKFIGISVASAVTALVGYYFYLDYSKYKQVEDDLKLAFDTRNTVSQFIEKTNFWPNQNIDAGLDKQISNRSVKSVVVGKEAVITVTLNAEALEGQEQTLIMVPKILKGRIVWNCLQGSLAEKYRPEACVKKE